MGRRRKNTKSEAQCQSAEAKPENTPLSPQPNVLECSKQQQSGSGNEHKHKNNGNVLESTLLEHAKNSYSSLKNEAENAVSIHEQSNKVENIISQSLKNQVEDRILDIHLTEEGKEEITKEGQSDLILVIKNKKGKKHKSKNSGKEISNECGISENLESGQNLCTENDNIQDTAISNSLHNNAAHLNPEKSRKQKRKKGNKKENEVQTSKMQEPKKDGTLHDMSHLSSNEKLNSRDLSIHKEALSESLEKQLSIKPELVSQIKKHSESLQHKDQNKPDDQVPSMSNICRSLSQERIANITKTAVNLSQSLGENEKSKISFTPELIQSLLSPAPKDISTREDELEYKIIQRQIFLNYTCHICKTIQGDSCILKRCNNCKMISYCSKEHQREHWPVHKDLCKAISKITKAEGMTHLYQKAIGLSPDEYRRYRIHYINICANLLGRELDLWEKEMFFFAQVCHICYEFQITKLKMCEKCNSICYCQPSHLKTDHNTWCNDLQIYRDLIIHQFHNGMIQPHLPQVTHQKYIPLNKEMRSFLLNTYIGTDKIFEMDRLQYVALTELATCPLSALFALQQSNFPLETTSSLIIHIVGAEMHFEGNVLDKWEAFILHLVPSLTMLHIVFIGPELQLNNTLPPSVTENICCPECTNNGKKLVFSFWSGYYHDYVLCDQYQKPSLITAFNDGLYRDTGFQGKDSWLPSLKVMLHDATIIIVVTEYTSEELPMDIKRMEKICPLNIILPPSKNPFSSAKPSLNFLSDEIVPVIFKNYYIAILQRK